MSGRGVAAYAPENRRPPWLAERLRDFVDLNPEFETTVNRLASWLARLDSDADED